ncbi:serine palmitoyltransferase component, partial [Coemansia sp. RSA 2603]
FEFTGRVRNVLNLASYNYLGFAQSEGPCADKVEAAMREHGLTQASTRAEAGCSQLLVETEDMVARFVGSEAALIVSMGYATNALNIPALVGRGCLILSDELNHSSLVSGARLSGASIRVFRHNDVASLETELRRSITQGQPRTHRPWKKILVVVEGLYSMEGEFCRLPEIVALRRRYGFYLFVDEAHSIGALGKRGRGVCDHFGVNPQEVDVLMGTFTKSFGAAGGYIAGSRALINHLRLKSHSAVYAEAMSVPVLAQVSSSMRMIMGEDREHALEGQQRLDQLAVNARYFARRLAEMGFMTMGDAGSPVVPLLLFSPAKIPAFSRECLKRNVAVVVVSYPATPIITGRVRFCISASHTRADLDYALEQISEIGDLLMLKFHKGAASAKRVAELEGGNRIKTESPDYPTFYFKAAAHCLNNPRNHSLPNSQGLLITHAIHTPMASSFVIACVGKPSAGKSSFLNAVTDASAKVGNYPFTTIEPNQGVAYYAMPCPCKTYNLSAQCKPRHGTCKNGTRHVPVRLLDVAGLVPGASEGLGLGNQFLDDLRQADALIHVVDASGTTDAQGKETRGYDPLDDVQWLRSEIEQWVLGNVERKWGGTVRRHVATRAAPLDTLHA